jgi:hypothetical protein
MSEMIPDSLASCENATAGEKRVFSFLRDILVPDDEFIVWYEPRMLSRYPDFLVWSQRHGLLVIEVKDWSAASISKMTPAAFQVDMNGSAQQCANPLAQVRDATNQLMNKMKIVPSFKNKDGAYKDRLIFPVGYAVFWTNITRAQAEQIKLTEVIPENLMFFQDDLRLDVDSRDDQRAFMARMKQAFTAAFTFDPLSHEDLKTLRHVIFPEVRVQSLRRLRNSEDEEYLKTLDLRQEKTAKSIGSGHRILQGVAGSGKTLVLACRARYLATVQRKWRILVVCYGIPLNRYIRQLIQSGGPSEHIQKIEVMHFHGLVKQLTGACLKKQEGETNEDYDHRIGQLLLGRMADGSVKTGCYDAILIDEGQDFDETWVQALARLLNSASDSLLFCYDGAQNVFGRKTINWKQVGLSVQGKRPVKLNTNYRNTVEILQAAQSIADGGAKTNASAPDEDETPPLIPVSTERHGPPPYIVQKSSAAAISAYILEKIDGYITSGECNWEDIGILYIDQYWAGFPGLFMKSFRAKFGDERLYWATQSRDHKIKLDLTTASAKLLTIESCKGLEFRVVFMVGLEKLPRPIKPIEVERRMAYVGLTRAQDELHVLYLQAKGFAGEMRRLGSNG